MLKPQMTPKELLRRPFRKWIDIISEKNEGESIAGNWTLTPNFQCYSKLMGMLMYFQSTSDVGTTVNQARM
jgi:hypothetical protein